MEESFNFKLYVYIPKGIHRVQLFEDVGSEMTIAYHLFLSKAQFFLGVVAPRLLLFMLESKKVTVYHPQE